MALPQEAQEVGFDQLSYQELKEQGWEIYHPTVKQCLDYAGNLDDKNRDNKFLIVLAKSLESISEKRALVLSTAYTAEHLSMPIQNIINDLDSVHHFVYVEQDISDKSTIDSFHVEAKNIDVNEIGLNNSTDSLALQKFKQIITDIYTQGASDIHWYLKEDSSKIAVRIDGRMVQWGYLNKHEARQTLSSALQQLSPGFAGFESDQKIINLPIDVTIEVKNAKGVSEKKKLKLRLNRQGSSDREGYKATFRIQDLSKVVDIMKLGYENTMATKLEGMLENPHGIFIATGETGSGKSTVIKGIIERLPSNQNGISIEDPIEFEYQHQFIQASQVDILNYETGETNLSKLLIQALRQDPDFINVAEIRDYIVADEALKHVRSGSKMTSTLHTNDAVTSYDRLIGLRVDLDTLTTTGLFLGFLGQKLLGKLCLNCSEEQHISLSSQEYTVYKANHKGCSYCNKGFIRGRIPVAELLIPKPSDNPFILNKDWDGWRIHLYQKGFKPMAYRALELCQERTICWQEANHNVPLFKKGLETILLHYKEANYFEL